MRRDRIGIFICSLLVISMLSCGEKDRRVADSAETSAAIAELEDQIAEASLMKARQDSILRDSMMRDSLQHTTSFAAGMPEMKSLIEKNHDVRGKYLETLGFHGMTQFEGEAKENQCSAGNYRLTGPEGESCRISWSQTADRTDVKITINKASGILERLYKKALDLESVTSDHLTHITRTGNTINILRTRVEELPSEE